MPPSAALDGAPPDAQAQLNGLLQADASKGKVAVHTFNPDASPQEKAAAAGKGREQVKKVGAKDEGAGGTELPVDTGGSNIVPTITISDADSEPADTSKPEEPQVALPGGIPAGPAPDIPDWYKVGWRAVGGIDNQVETEGEAKEKSVLALFLKEQYYGDWYHNAALIFFAVFASHFLTRFGFGFGWLFIILAACHTYYTTSMERVRRRSRDDIQRELVKTRLASEHETADWINHFLDRFWLIYEPVLSQTVISSVDQVLSANTPPFLDSLRLSTFTLGTKAPRIDKVRTFPRTADDIIMMDWGLSFTPNDIMDVTPRQLQTKVNPKIVLAVRVGKGLAGANMPILLEDITFSGLMRVRMKLMTAFPHVQIVDVSFLEKPVVDFVLKPLGGDTFGLDIAHIPGLQAFIREMIHGTLGPMMYEPNVFTLNLEQMLSGAPLDTAIGVLQVTVESARGIKGVKVGGGSPDPFVSMSVNQRSELARTKYKHNTYNPTWNETKFLLVNNLTENLVLGVWDYNDHRKNTELGQVSFELAKLQDDAVWEAIEQPILRDGKERGTLRYDVSFYPVLKPQAVAGSTEEEIPETNVGIVRLTLHQAKDLDQSKSTLGDLNPFAKVYLGNSTTAILNTSEKKKMKHTASPVWEESVEFLCSDRKSSKIVVKVIDDRDFLKDPMIGYMAIRLEDLLGAQLEAGRDWWPLSGCKSGRLRMSAEWKPLNMAGSLHGADSFTPPIGVVRLLLQKATDVKNVEAALGGKSDPYVRVQVGNVTRGRTDVVNNNLNPEWDQIIYIPVHSLRENLMLECMDYQHLTKDRSLGSVELRVSELAQAVEDARYPYASTGKKDTEDPIKLDKGGGYKGKLHYVAEFIPALALNGVKFDSGPNEVQRAAESGAGEDDGDDARDGSSMSSSDEEIERVPEGITVRQPMGSHGQRNGSPPADSVKTSESAVTAPTTQTSDTKEANGTPEEVSQPKGIAMSREELFQQQSGILVCNVIGGQLAKKARLEVLLDDGYWPAFSTIKPRSTHASWEQIGEGFIKELDFGRVWLRLNDNDDGDKDDVVAEWKGDAKDFLKQALNGPATFTLVDEDEKSHSTVQIEARYVPVPVQLEARESINNQGTLRVELVDGHDIHAADRGGKSDPFAVFILNGQKVFKSQTKKKTLNPEWNETFAVGVPSRVGSDFGLEIFDWNQIEQAKKLGSAKIELADLEPFQGTERVVQLTHTKHGDKGSVRVRLMFTPEIIAKARKNTSTFSSAGRAMTQIGSAPVSGAKGVGHAVGKVFKRDHTKSSTDGDDVPAPTAPAGQSSHPIGASDGVGTIGSANGGALKASDSNSSLPVVNESGTLKITILDAKDVAASDGDPVKGYVAVRVGDKEHKTKQQGKSHSPQWNETLIFAAGTFTPKAHIWVYDYKTLGKDKVVGEAEIDIWRHIQPRGATSAEVSLELRNGSGLLRAQLEFDPDANPLHRSDTNKSPRLDPSHGASPSRFSLSRRRLADTSTSDD